MANGQKYITGYEDPSDSESEEPTDEILYAKEIVEELEKRVLNLTKQLQELQSSSEQQQATIASIESVRDSQIQELQQQVKDAKEIIEKLEKKVKQLQELQSSSKQQQTTIISLESVRDSQIQEIQELRQQLKENFIEHKLITSLQKRVQELEAQVNELKCKQKSYECDQDRLYLCQIAVEFERALCSHVFPEAFSKDKGSSSANLDRLLNMLNSGDQGLIPSKVKQKHDIDDVLSKARQRWERVCDKLQLPPEWKTITGKEVNFSHTSVPPIFRAMALLKEIRNPVAHPSPVSLQVAEQKIEATSIQDDMEEWEFDLVRDFISSLRTNIRKSGIQTSQNRFEL